MVESTVSRRVKLVAEDLSVIVEKRPVLRNVSLQIFTGERLAVIGPAGSGKTTFLRSLNRLNELTPQVAHSGRILLDGHDIFDPATDVAELRRRIGLINAGCLPLPESIFENVAVGLKLARPHDSAHLEERVVAGLQRAQLWDEVKDRLDQPAGRLHSDQQRRLCLARVLALEPEVLLLDEPSAGLDPLATGRLEDLLAELSAHLAIVLVTHDNRQAARASDRTALLWAGELIECGPTQTLFFNPTQPRTNDFITGRFQSR